MKNIHIFPDRGGAGRRLQVEVESSSAGGHLVENAGACGTKEQGWHNRVEHAVADRAAPTQRPTLAGKARDT